MNKTILFISDLFRISYGKSFYMDPVVYSVFQLFSEQIFEATGQYPVLNLSRDTNLFDVKKFYELCNYEYTEDSWLKISSGQISTDAENYFVSSFQDYFLICFHANPIMLKLFQKHNIPYIDTFEGSVRFLEDIHFVMRTNIPEIYQKLLTYQYPESAIYMEAAHLKARYQSYGINEVNLRPNSLLLCGQTYTDIALLKGEKYISLNNLENQFKQIIDKYDYIYYKPHPHAGNDSLNTEFIKSFSDFEIRNDNIYALMSSPKITGVAALSSGVLKEAQYFRKKIHILSHLYVDYHVDSPNFDVNKFVILTNDYFSPTFWVDILSPCLKTKQVKYFNFNNNSGYLRANIFSWWGYDIETFHPYYKNSINNLNNQVGQLIKQQVNNKQLNQHIEGHQYVNKKKFKTLRHFLALFCPSKEIRHKIRGK